VVSQHSTSNASVKSKYVASAVFSETTNSVILLKAAIRLH